MTRLLRRGSYKKNKTSVCQYSYHHNKIPPGQPFLRACYCYKREVHAHDISTHVARAYFSLLLKINPKVQHRVPRRRFEKVQEKVKRLNNNGEYVQRSAAQRSAAQHSTAQHSSALIQARAFFNLDIGALFCTVYYRLLLCRSPPHPTLPKRSGSRDRVDRQTVSGRPRVLLASFPTPILVLQVYYYY